VTSGGTRQERYPEAGAERLRTGLAALVGREAGAPATIEDFGPLVGGTMRHAWKLDVEILSGSLTGFHRLIYLEDREGSRLGTRKRLGREDELGLLRLMHGAGVRVPRPYWQIGEGDPTGVGPGLIVERVDGEVIARRILKDSAFETVRPRLLQQMGEELAKIHAVRADTASRLPRPGPGEAPAEVELEQVERSLGEIGEPHPALELGLRRLRQLALPCPSPVIVHSDYRLGNFLIDPERGLTAVLDWELAHLGDPGEDLGWVVMRFWRCVDRPGQRALGPRERLLDAYGAASGRRLDANRLRYWEAFANLRWAIVTLEQAHRHLSGRERSLELGMIGRHCAEVERELLRLLQGL
jgi:aminoglycoside phosphotransferase (APT) family kinase protein